MQNGLLLLIGEGHILEGDIAADFRERDCAVRVFIFRGFSQHLAGAFQPGDRLGDLGPDADDLEQRRGQIAEEHGVGKESAQRELAGQDLPRSHEHDDGADDAHQRRRRQAHDRGRGQRLEHILQQALDPEAEDLVLAVLGVVALHHAHTAQRFGQAAGDLGIDLGAFAKDGADGAKRFPQPESEHQQECRRRFRSSPG